MPTVGVGRGKVRELYSMAFYGSWAQERSGANCLRNIHHTRPAAAAFGSGYEHVSWSAFSRRCRKSARRTQFNFKSASPHESQLVEGALGHSFLDVLPARLIGDTDYDGSSYEEGDRLGWISAELDNFSLGSIIFVRS